MDTVQDDHYFRREDRAVRWRRIAQCVLDPHDLAAVKLLVGRPKDIGLLAVFRSVFDD